MSHRRVVRSLAALVLLAIAGCGAEHGAHGTTPADTSPGGRVVEVTMADIRFETESLSVAAGETVEFRFVNEGQIPHDAFIGDTAAQEQHGVEMAGMAGHDHGTAGAVTVQPGATETLTYTFDEAGSLEVGCHQPGHYEAGMKIAVTVG